MPKDYYLLLGLSRGAKADEIKQAYRTIAKRYHPDISGSREHSQKFLEVKEAYETLIDDVKRREYHQSLDQQAQTKRSPASNRNHQGPAFGPENFQRRSASWIETLFTDLLAGSAPQAEHEPEAEDLCFEAVLSPEEARRGRRFSMKLPLRTACRFCGGRAVWARSGCPLCSGSGRQRVEQSVTLTLPPDLSHGTRLSYPLDRVGLPGQSLLIVIRIDPFL